jgi:hypothetical protein
VVRKTASDGPRQPRLAWATPLPFVATIHASWLLRAEGRKTGD